MRRLVLVAALLVGGCGGDGGAGSAGFRAFGAAVIRLLPGGAEWCVLRADTPALRQRGLMEARDLAGYDGMLFDFGAEVDGGFWMRDTPLPLSIAFFSADGALVSTLDMAPCGDRPDCPTYRAAGPYRWALEVPRGDLPRLGVGPGARLDVAPARGSCHTPRADS